MINEKGDYTDKDPAANQGTRIQPQSHKFSPEELRVLKECNDESFVKRSLPLGTAFGLTSYAAIQQGYLKRNARFGAIPKVSLAVILGYFIGKLSYQQQCAEKLMALPNSYLGQLLRDRRDGKMTSIQTKQSTMAMFGATSSDIYSDAGPGSSLNLDTDRPNYDSDAYQSNSNITPPQESSAPPLSPKSYDDLRKNNREHYDGHRQDPYKVDPSAMPPIARAKPPAHSPATNKYGDVID